MNSRKPLEDCGFFILVVDPGLFGEPGEFQDAVSEYAEQLRATRPLDPKQPVRVPFERSEAQRQKTLEAGTIEVEEVVVVALRKVCQ